MNELLNIGFHAVHLAVIWLNMFGWMYPKRRRLAATVQMITIACWVGFGVLYGWWGYCPLTDWHWDLKRSMGETGMPGNYIAYILREWVGLTLPGDFLRGLILGCFTMAVLANGYLLRHRK